MTSPSSISSSSKNNKVMHIALGDVSCLITTHWQMRQGSAAASADDPHSFSTTHAVYNGMYVPRSLLVGNRGGHVALPIMEDISSTWSGTVETIVLSDPLTSSSSHIPGVDCTAWERYRAPVLLPPPSSFYASQGRQVDWDAEDLLEEDEEDPSYNVAEPHHTVYTETEAPRDSTPRTEEEVIPDLPPKTDEAWYDVLRRAPMHPHTCMEAPPLSESGFEDALWDRVRSVLEACDQSPGLWLMQDATVWATEAGTHLLQTWQEECGPGASTIYIEPNEDGMDATREMIRHMCVLADQTAESTLWIPMQLGPEEGTPMAVARALECATMSYRQGGPVTFRSTYSDDVDSNHWTYRDFRRALQRHSASRNVLELDMVRDDLALDSSLLSFLQPGTSVERDQRMKSRLPQVHSAPGDWMNDASGWWTSLTPTSGSSMGPNQCDRNRHYHYALSTSLRHSVQSDEVPRYVTSIMESMGIRYRPEQALCTFDPIVKHYWMYASSETPTILSVLGNTTRIYPYLHARAAIKIPSYLGGSSMERDDVLEAQSECLDLRDTYAPPRSSGLLPDDNNAGLDFDF